MDYTAKIIVKEDPDKIYKCLVPEKISRERSSVKIKKEKGVLVINVEAKDAVALRATLNSISQVLAVYHKTKSIK